MSFVIVFSFMEELAEAANVMQTLCRAPAVEYPIKKHWMWSVSAALRLGHSNWARGCETFREGRTLLCVLTLNKHNTSAAESAFTFLDTG